MRIYLAAPMSKAYVLDDLVNRIDKGDLTHKPLILESYYKASATLEKRIPYFGDFMLDSGAFTFMMGNGKANWDEYAEGYIDFIKRNKVSKYFELDIDSIVGYDRVVKIRSHIEKRTGVQPIPVWHKSRGMDNFRSTCDDYPYIALGGIVSGEVKQNEYKHFPLLISEAHKRGAKIHGLGFSSLKWLPICHFDSVDSTTWLTGNKGGYIARFNGKTIERVYAPDGMKLSNPRESAIKNFQEWIKFQQYAEEHL